MARVLIPAPSLMQRVTQPYRHACGATVEFEECDVKYDPRDGDYVVCPACGKTPWIAVTALRWVR